MTNIDDSTQTPPGNWFGAIDGRLHERMREALADQGLRPGGWRILHTLAEGPATPAELAEKLPHRGARGRDRQHDRGRPNRYDAAGNEHAPSHEHGWHDSGCDHQAHHGGNSRDALTEYGHSGYGYRYGDPRLGDSHRGFAPGGHDHPHGHPGWRGQEPRDERPAAPGYATGVGRPDTVSAEDRHHDHHEHEHEHDHDHDHDHDHEHTHAHHAHAAHLGAEHAFERGYEHGFDRGYAFGAARAGLAFPHAFPQAFPGAFPPAPFGPFHGGHPFAGPFAGGGAPFPGHFPGGFGRPFPGGAPFGGHGDGGWPPFDGDPRRFRRGHQGGRDHRGDHRIHRIERILADFVERGWVWFDGDRATLTDEGRAAHDTAFERVSAARADLVNGIAEDDYATTMATLETMARNLGWRPAQADAQPEDGAHNASDAAPDAASDASPEAPQEGEPKMEA